MTKKEIPYQNISCSYYDQLEAYATQKTRCSIVFKENTIEQSINGTIADLFAKDGAEYLKLDNGIVIRLDHIVSVNGILLNYAC